MCGTCVIQDYQESEFRNRPQSVLPYVEVGYCTSLFRIAIHLQEKTWNGVEANYEIPERIRKEAEIAERVAIGIDLIDSFALERGVLTLYPLF